MDESATGLSFEEMGIASALAQRELHVPLNQRSYAWTEDAVQTLFDDLFRAFRAKEKIYFLGAIVLTRDANGRLQVADGQQRLATISILISAVRDFLIELGDGPGAAKYESRYLLDYDVRTKEFAPKLHLNFEDHDYFVERILKSKPSRSEFKGKSFGSHERLRVAARLSEECVRKVAGTHKVAEKADQLYDWVDFLHDAAKVIVISVSGRVGNAFKMFETLNARGMPASQTDILKNFLFDKAKSRIADIHPHWMTMVSTIEELGKDDLLLTFIRHYWIAHNGPTTERELGEKIEEAIKGEKQALDMVSTLAEWSSDYVALLSPRDHIRWKEFSTEARKNIYTITKELGGEQIRPLLLAIARRFTVKEAEKAFKALVSVTVRFLIVGGGGGGFLDRHYGQIAAAVTGGEIARSKDLVQRLRTVAPNDEIFKRSFATATVSRSNLARYYLRAIELYTRTMEKAQMVPNDDVMAVNLEHVLPVTPSVEWGISAEVAAAYYKRLGNMALLSSSDNVDLGNKTFAEKKKTLKDSAFIRTREIAKATKWGPVEIDRRQAALAELAPDVWPL